MQNSCRIFFNSFPGSLFLQDEKLTQHLIKNELIELYLGNFSSKDAVQCQLAIASTCPNIIRSDLVFQNLRRQFNDYTPENQENLDWLLLLALRLPLSQSEWLDMLGKKYLFSPWNYFTLEIQIFL